MKSIALILTVSLLFALLACNNTSNKPGKQNESTRAELSEEKKDMEKEDSLQYLISESQVGKFRIGGDIPRASGIYEIRKTQQVRATEEGPVEEPTYRVSRDGNDLLVLKPQYDHDQEGYNSKIGEIMVLSDKYKTKEGVGVSSTITEFQKVYPDFEIWYTYVSGRYIIESAKLSAQFILHEQDFTGEMNVNSVRVMLKKDDFKQDASIVKIRIYK